MQIELNCAVLTKTSLIVIFNFSLNCSRETPDLLYDDITSPFTATELEELTDDGRSDFFNVSHSGSDSLRRLFTIGSKVIVFMLPLYFKVRQIAPKRRMPTNVVRPPL